MKVQHTKQNKKLIALVGPTASGKTAVAVQLAQQLGTEVVSADSRQVYAQLQIGTARPTEQELGGVRHHLLGHRTVHQPYTAADYEAEALAALHQVYENHDVAVLAGGTGLYVQAVLRGFDPMPAAAAGRRAELEAALAEHGVAALAERLLQLDPTAADHLDLRNPRRVIRALELVETTGQPLAQVRTGQQASRPFDAQVFVLDWPREKLYERIDQRTAQMMDQGLEEEVRRMWPNRHLQALQTVGYREWAPYFAHQATLQQVQAAITQNTRRYAKRQLTWFRHQLQATWLDAEQPDLAVGHMVEWAQAE